MSTDFTIFVKKVAVMPPFYRFSVLPHRHRHQQPKQKENSKKTNTNKPKQTALTQTNDFAKQTKHAENEPNAVNIYYIYILFLFFCIIERTAVTSPTAFMFIVVVNYVDNIIKLFIEDLYFDIKGVL